LVVVVVQFIGDGAESTSELYDKVRRKEFKKRKVRSSIRIRSLLFALNREASSLGNGSLPPRCYSTLC